MTSSRLDRGSPAVRFEDALRELMHVHRLEQARLLRVACHHRMRSSLQSGSLLPPPRSPRELSECRTRKDWRAVALEEIRTARADGAGVDPVLAELARTGIASWRTASSIAGAALEVEPCCRGRVVLARAWIFERRLAEAVGILLELLEADLPEDVRLETLEALAAASELVGDVEGSIAFREVALASKGGDLGLAVSLLALALCAGDEPRASAASDRLRRLDLGVPGVRARFDAALIGVRRQLDALRIPVDRAPSAREAWIRAFVGRDRGAGVEVANLVLRG